MKDKPSFKKAANLVKAANTFKNIVKERVAERKEYEKKEDKEVDEDREDDVPDIKAIAARNQYLEKQAQLLADLNTRLAEKRAMTDTELKKDPFRWEDDNKEQISTRCLEHPAYWDWS